MNLYIEKYILRFQQFKAYKLMIDGRHLSFKDVIDLIDDYKTTQYFFKNFPNFKKFSTNNLHCRYFIIDKTTAEKAVEFLEPYLIMRELIK